MQEGEREKWGFYIPWWLYWLAVPLVGLARPFLWVLGFNINIRWEDSEGEHAREQEPK